MASLNEIIQNINQNNDNTKKRLNVREVMLILPHAR